MKKFKFRLERVLRYRRAIRDEKLRDLMLKNAKLKESEDRLATLEDEMRRDSPESGIVPVESLYMRGLYAARLKDEIINQRLVIVQCESEVQEALAAYVEASKDVKTLTTLKDKRRTEYMDYVAHEDAKFLDELAVQKGNSMKS